MQFDGQERVTGMKSQPSYPGVVKVLVVDDHALVRKGLCGLIDEEEDFQVCGEASGATEALQKVEETSPNFMIVDLTLKEGNGLELIKQVVATREDIKILVASMHDDTLYAERSIRAGANGYINKEEATEKVVEAMRTILKGKVYLSQKMHDRILQGMTHSGDEPGQSPLELLSDREIEVFELIGQALSTKGIADKLNLSVKTVETYRDNIKRKLNLEGSNELTRSAVQFVLEQK